MKKIILTICLIVFGAASVSAENWEPVYIQWDTWPCYPEAYIDMDNLSAPVHEMTNASYAQTVRLTWESSHWHYHYNEPNGSNYDWYYKDVYDYSCEDPTPQEPLHCSDNVMSGDELGIDCGGSCSETCGDGCPEGYTLVLVPGGDPYCYKTIDPNSYADCPPGFDLVYFAGEPQCRIESDTILMGESEDPPPDPTSNPWPGVDEVTTDTISSTVDNGDGTETETTTTTTTTTNNDDTSSTSTTITTTTKDSTTGDIISTGTVTTDPQALQFDDSGIIAAVNNARRSITSKIDDTNTKLDGIAEGIDSLTEDLSDTASADTTSAVESTGTSETDDYENAMSSAFSDVVNNTDLDNFPVSESVTDQALNILPSPGECSPFQFDIMFAGASRHFEVPCEIFDRVKRVLSWVIYLITLSAMVDLLLDPPKVK